MKEISFICLSVLNARTKLHSSLFPICENEKRKGQMHLNKNHNIYIAKDSRSVIKRRGPGISPATMNVAPSYFQRIDRRKIEPKKIPRCLIPSLLVVFPWQLDILVIPLLVTCWALKFKIKAVETPLIVVHNR